MALLTVPEMSNSRLSSCTGAICSAYVGMIALSELTDLNLIGSDFRLTSQLEGFAYAHAPSMTAPALGEINAQIYVILFA